MGKPNSERVQEVYAHSNTHCSMCNKRIFQQEAMAIKHKSNKLLWIKCLDCYLGRGYVIHIGG